MALRDRQISGVPLTKTQSEVISHAMTLLVPVLGYNFWYPALHIPRELWFPLAIVGMIVHVGISIEIVPNNVERNLLWMGSYTGASFSNGICFIPRLPNPFILIAIRVVAGEEIYRKFLWSLEGDVKIHSIIREFVAEGLTRDGVRVFIKGMARFEVESAATYSSQEGEDRVAQAAVAEFVAGVKASVIAQHTAEELMRGYHSGGSHDLHEWMTQAWNLVETYGVSLGSVMISEVEITSKQVERAFDRAQAKEVFVAGAKSLAETFAAFQASLPPGTSEEVALMLFNADRIDAGQPPATLNVVKFK